MRALSVLALVAASFAVAACTSTYHPEYHPVTVTSYEQHVTNAGTASAPPAPGATMVAPAPPAPPPPPPWSAWPSE